jgi:hypothetical protein
MSRDKPTFAEFMANMFGPCIDHEHEQVGRCVYCKTCGRRLYQGGVMNSEELAAIREAINLDSSPVAASSETDKAGPDD